MFCCFLGGLGGWCTLFGWKLENIWWNWAGDNKITKCQHVDVIKRYCYLKTYHDVYHTNAFFNLYIYCFILTYIHIYIYTYTFVYIDRVLILWYFQGISGVYLHVKWEPVPRNRATTFRFLGWFGPNLSGKNKKARRFFFSEKKKLQAFPKTEHGRLPTLKGE